MTISLSLKPRAKRLKLTSGSTPSLSCIFTVAGALHQFDVIAAAASSTGKHGRRRRSRRNEASLTATMGALISTCSEHAPSATALLLRLATFWGREDAFVNPIEVPTGTVRSWYHERKSSFASLGTVACQSDIATVGLVSFIEGPCGEVEAVVPPVRHVEPRCSRTLELAARRASTRNRSAESMRRRHTGAISPPPRTSQTQPQRRPQSVDASVPLAAMNRKSLRDALRCRCLDARGSPSQLRACLEQYCAEHPFEALKANTLKARCPGILFSCSTKTESVALFQRVHGDD